MKNEAPCPQCGWPIAIHYDAPDSVGIDLAGYYLSHEPWVPYPKWTDCPLRNHTHDMSKFSSVAEAEAARAALPATPSAGE